MFSKIKKKSIYSFSSSLLAVFICVIPIQSIAIEKKTLGMVTGPKTGTYFIFGRDIAVSAKKSGLELEISSSEGSIDNIKRINNDRNFSLGIVQSDVLGFLGRSKSPDSMKIAKNLRIIFPFYNEEIHVLARNDINDFKDLQGKKVAVGEDESGNMLTSINLFSIMNITPAKTIKISSAQSVVAVLKGEIDATIFVGGKPVRLFKNLEDLSLPENQQYKEMLSKVHFIPMDSPKMLEEYKPAKITHNDYNFVNEEVKTISVPAILISSDSSNEKNKSSCEKIGTIAKIIRASLPSLKISGHDKWKEVNLDANISSWKKDKCALGK